MTEAKFDYQFEFPPEAGGMSVAVLEADTRVAVAFATLGTSRNGNVRLAVRTTLPAGNYVAETTGWDAPVRDPGGDEPARVIFVKPALVNGVAT